jgi:copper chaperone CopZ
MNMAETTIFVKEATTDSIIQQIEQLLNQIDGVERVLIDTEDGEVKLEFDTDKITEEEIASMLMEQNYLLH